MSRIEIQILEPWNQVDYEAALKEQTKRNEQSGSKAGWILFCCPPTITLGIRGHFSDVLMPIDELKRLGVRLLPVNRGGQVTYHGPGQIVAFPYGSLERHVGDPRGVKKFICGLEDRLQVWIQNTLQKYQPERKSLQVRREANETGLWVWDEQGIRKKILSIGMSFHRNGIQHGFALNVLPMDQGFSLVNACGEIGARPQSLLTQDQLNAFDTVRSELKDILAV